MKYTFFNSLKIIIIFIRNIWISSMYFRLCQCKLFNRGTLRKVSQIDWLEIRIRPLIRGCYSKIVFLFLDQNICCVHSKESSQRDGSFEHPKHMFKLMGKKIITILCSKCFLIWSYPLFADPGFILFWKNCSSRSAGFWRSHLIRIHTLFYSD